MAVDNLQAEILSSSQSLNIFTDASSTAIRMSGNYGVRQAYCSGFIIYDGYTAVDMYYEIDRITNDTNYAELNSIYLALQLVANKYNNSNIIRYINIFSDSLEAVTLIRNQKRLNEIIYHNDIELYRHSIRLNSLLLQIVKLLSESTMYINIYHIRGHMDESQIRRFKSEFCRYNSRKDNNMISNDIALFLIDGNYNVDNFTRFHAQYQIATYYDFYANEYLDKKPVLYYLPRKEDYNLDKVKWLVNNTTRNSFY